MFSQHGYIDCILPPPHNSLTGEKAREILREVKETQETFKKQRETIKLEAEVSMYTSQLCACSCVLYSELPYSGKFSLGANFCNFRGQTCFHKNKSCERWTKMEIDDITTCVHRVPMWARWLSTVCLPSSLNGCYKEESASYCTKYQQTRKKRSEDVTSTDRGVVRVSRITQK